MEYGYFERRLKSKDAEIDTLRAEVDRLREGAQFVMDNSLDLSCRDRLNLEMYLSNKEALK